MTTTRSRRGLVMGAAVVAATAGVGTQLWRSRTGAAPATAARESAAPFWGTTFQSLNGSPLRADAWRGRPLLVNFWATWCAPCVTELPMLDRFHATQGTHGLGVLALALDNAEKVQRFMAEHALKLPVAIAEVGGVGLARALGNEKGGLPYSIVLDRDGHLVQRKLGLLTEADLESWRAGAS